MQLGLLLDMIVLDRDTEVAAEETVPRYVGSALYNGFIPDFSFPSDTASS